MSVQVIYETFQTDMQAGDSLNNQGPFTIDEEFIDGYIEDVFVDLSGFENSFDSSDRDLRFDVFSNGINEISSGAISINQETTVGIVSTTADVWVYEGLETNISLGFGDADENFEALNDNPEITLQFVVRGV